MDGLEPAELRDRILRLENEAVEHRELINEAASLADTLADREAQLDALEFEFAEYRSEIESDVGQITAVVSGLQATEKAGIRATFGTETKELSGAVEMDLDGAKVMMKGGNPVVMKAEVCSAAHVSGSPRASWRETPKGARREPLGSPLTTTLAELHEVETTLKSRLEAKEGSTDDEEWVTQLQDKLVQLEAEVAAAKAETRKAAEARQGALDTMEHIKVGLKSEMEATKEVREAYAALQASSSEERQEAQKRINQLQRLVDELKDKIDGHESELVTVEYEQRAKAATEAAESQLKLEEKLESVTLLFSKEVKRLREATDSKNALLEIQQKKIASLQAQAVALDQQLTMSVLEHDKEVSTLKQELSDRKAELEGSHQAILDVERKAQTTLKQNDSDREIQMNQLLQQHQYV